MTYAVVTLGCRVNQADSLELEASLVSKGARSSTPETADVVVVNTCAVTAGAEQGARQAIRRIHRINPGARVVVTGCYATRRPAEVSLIDGVSAVVDNDGKPRLDRAVLGWHDPTTTERFGGGEGPCGAAIEPGIAGRTAWTLRVQTGCDESCSYCIIPTTRGRSRSRTIQDLLDETERVVAWGFKEIALTGVHLGSWGRDLVPRLALIDLLDALSGSSAPVRFRISSLEPMDCSRAVVDRVAADPRFAPHFHLPLQHASEVMLRAMRRPYDRATYERLVDRIRRVLPDAAIGTDVIAGFPGETDADADELADYLASSPLTHVHVFPYSDRPGTAASSIGPKVHGAVVRARTERLRLVGRRLASRFQSAAVGQVRDGLTLEDGTLVVTDNYLKVRILPGRSRNEWVKVRILDAANPLRGEAVSLA